MSERQTSPGDHVAAWFRRCDSASIVVILLARESAIGGDGNASRERIEAIEIETANIERIIPCETTGSGDIHVRCRECRGVRHGCRGDGHVGRRGWRLIHGGGSARRG